MADKHYATVKVTVTIPIDLHGAEPTQPNLIQAAHNQVGYVISKLTKEFGHVSYTTPKVCTLTTDLDET